MKVGQKIITILQAMGISIGIIAAAVSAVALFMEMLQFIQDRIPTILNLEVIVGFIFFVVITFIAYMKLSEREDQDLERR